MSNVEWGLTFLAILLAPFYLHYIAKFIAAGFYRGKRLAQRPETKDAEESGEA